MVPVLFVLASALCFCGWSKFFFPSSAFWSSTGKHSGSTALLDLYKWLTHVYPTLFVLSFADNTKFIKTISSFNDCLLLQQDISSVQAWCRTWNLPLNTGKCNALRFASKEGQDSYQYLLDNAKKTYQKFNEMGIIVKDDLSWSDHYNHVCSKGYRSLNLIRRTVTPNSPMKVKKQLLPFSC